MCKAKVYINKNYFPCLHEEISKNNLDLKQVKLLINLLIRFNIPKVAILDFFKLLNIESIENNGIRIIIDEIIYAHGKGYLEDINCQDIRRVFRLQFNYCNNAKCIFKQKKTPKTKNIHRLLKYPTNHLTGFDYLNKSTRLYGKHYTVILKTIWYVLLSTKISKKRLQLGQISTDGRIFALLVLKSGHGKNEMKRVLKSIVKKVEEPSSLHPEQLVGKVIVKGTGKNTVTKEIRGYLSRDFIIIDEGRHILTSMDMMYSESRKYLRLAMDAYPNNELKKKPVDIEFIDALVYKPSCGICIFTQPYSFEEDFATDGDLRRFLVPYVPMSQLPDFNDLERRIRDTTDTDGSLENLIECLNSMNVIDNAFEFGEDAIEEFVEAHQSLIYYGLNYSSKVRNFIDIAKYTLQNVLLKFCAVQALQSGSNSVSVEHVEQAYVDLFEILDHQYRFIESKIKGDISYGQNWAGATGNDQKCLKRLYEEGAISESSSNVSNEEYKDVIMELCNVKERQAMNIKKKHLNNGWILTKKGHESRVWLAFKLSDDELNENAKYARNAKVAIRKYRDFVEKIFLK